MCGTVLHGQTSIFFVRNTGREALQMYMTAGIIQLFNTGYSHLSLKIGTVLAGLLTLPFIYLLGKEVGSKRIGLLAFVFAGIAYWPNVISRVGLRFPLYPLFVAPVLYFLLRGIRTSNRNDFILSGLFLGIGLHGYTPIRILPVVILVAVGLYLIHCPISPGEKANRLAAGDPGSDGIVRVFTLVALCHN
jgi:4-amino-4-deoxy-L-arabinose transferase-like glycosyltransferase